MRTLLVVLFGLLICGLGAQTAVPPALGDGSAANPYQIATLQNLYWITQNEWALNRNYIQTADIDAWECRNWTPDAYGGVGWPGIGSGNWNRSFYGVYDGQGHIVDNIYIRNVPRGAGLFGQTSDLSTGAPGPVTIKNLGVTNVDIVGTNYVGALVGKGDYCNIINCWSSGTISTVPSRIYPPWQNPLTYKDYVGGLAGYRTGYGSISNCYSTCNVSNGSPEDGGNYTGGLVGFCGGIYNSYATGNVTGKNNVGGLTGEVYNVMNDCFASGNVIGNDNVGGLSAIVNCGNGINNCYASGNVTGNAQVGGLASELMFTDASRCYSTGFVTGISRSGGLIGWINPDYLDWTHAYNCFWDVESSGLTTSAAGTGKTTALMKTMSTFTSATWGFLGYNGTSWGLNPAANSGYPFLAIQNLNQPCSVTTQTVINIGPTSATGRGTVTNFGRPNIGQRGFCWSTEENPDLGDSYSELGSAAALGAFSGTLTGLLPYTQYYVRAYATNARDTAYGEQTQFTSAPEFALISPLDATAITTTTATLNGTVVNPGVPNATQHGFCWGTSTTPSLANSYNELGAITGTGNFSSEITGLAIYTHYYYRTYAINLAGTFYGTVGEFTTLPTPTTVTTQAVTGIQATHAVGNGNITVLGIPNPYEYGLCWSPTQNPTIENSRSILTNATATGAYTTGIMGLSPLTKYYVRAYVKTLVQTSYGNQVNFTTAALDGTGTQGDPYLIGTLADLAYIQNSSFWNQQKYFVQTADIDAAATSTWNGGEGWLPIWYFKSNYDGQNHTISHLFINRAGTDYQALWGDTRDGAVIKNLSLIDVNIVGRQFTAPMVATGQSTTLSNCSSSGLVNGSDSAGGIVGSSNTNTISNCASSCSIIGRPGGWSVGGISGYAYLTNINNCYFTGSLNGDAKVGGISGNFLQSTISNCYSSGSVTALSQFGGLVGSKYSATITNSYWDLDTSGQSTSQGGIGKHTYELQTKTTYTNTGWDYKGETANGENEIWNIGNGRNNGYPYLNWQNSSDQPDNPGVTTTQSATGILTASVTANGTVWYLGNATQHGFCWNTAGNPTISDTKVSMGVPALGAYAATISGLSQLTTYYLRAYTTNALGTSYGNQVLFSTPEALLELSTQAATSVTQTTATGNGTIEVLGNYAITQHGHCWSTTTPPTILGSHTELGSIAAVGTFVSELTNLSPYTLYYLCAYATNSQGVTYGNIIEFTTAAVLPQVSLISVADVTDSTCNFSGSIDVMGIPQPVQHGFCWNTSGNPSTDDAKTELGVALETGVFTSEAAGLAAYTHYYVKAYAATSLETVYSNELEFSTLPGLAAVSTLESSNIATYSATGQAVITSLGAPNPIQHGHCWSVSPDPVIADALSPSSKDGRTLPSEVFFTELGSAIDTGVYSSNLTNLSAFTLYYIRAYATNLAGTAYGDVLTFRTLPVPAVVSTGSVTEISATTAALHGSLDELGSPAPDQHGFCYGIAENPTLSNFHIDLGAPTEVGAFSSNLSGLSPSTTYFVRAYASTSGTVYYGNQVSFATNPLPSLASVTTQAVTAISGSTATGNGTLVSLGYPNPTEYGFCWSTGHNPTLENSKVVLLNATQTGSFSTAIMGLNPAVKYYVRAFATNEAGTAYGSETSFTTLAFIGFGTVESPFQIGNLADLRILSNDDSYSPIYANKHFIQTADINAAATSSWNDNTGFKPFCDYYYSPFTGSYDGQNHTIEGLTIARSGSLYQGMFGHTEGATISNLTLSNISIICDHNSGGIIGRALSSTLNHCQVSGAISGNQSIGGLVGLNYGTTLNYCVNESSVHGNGYVGALVGTAYDNAQIKFCYNEGTITNSSSYTGGLVGYCTSTRIENCYNRGSIQGGAETGGLVGRLNQGYLNHCYNSGQVSGSSCGGLIGLYYYDEFTYSYWDINSSGQNFSNSGSMTYGVSNVAGYTTAQMKLQSSYVNWNFSTVWGISAGVNNGYPYLLDNYEIQSLGSPEPSISYNASLNSVEISWNAVPFALSYALYCTDDPSAEFPSGWTQLSMLSAQQPLIYTDNFRHSGRFYRLVASTQTP